MKGMDIYNPYFNPRRRRRRRNPSLPNPIGRVLPARLTQDVDFMEMGCATGGLAAAYLIPKLIVKKVDTTAQKLLKLALAAGVALGVGYGARQMVSASAAKAAVIGGLAGVGVQAIETLTKWKVGEEHLAFPPGIKMIQAAQTVSPALTRESEDVQLLRP